MDKIDFRIFIIFLLSIKKLSTKIKKNKKKPNAEVELIYK